MTRDPTTLYEIFRKYEAQKMGARIVKRHVANPVSWSEMLGKLEGLQSLVGRDREIAEEEGDKRAARELQGIERTLQQVWSKLWTKYKQYR